MNFIDTTGHVFSLPSYDDIPLHLKYKEGDYVFWLKDQEISINNYYILPIRMIVNVNDVIFEYNGEIIQDPLKLDITIDSNFYKLLGPKYIQEKLEQNNSIKESIEIDFDEAKSALSIDDFYFDKVNNYNNLIVESGTEKYYLFPFYVIGKCDIEGTILSNIMIKISTKTESVSISKKWFTRDQLYDYFLKKTMTDIKIYEVDPETGEETYYTSIRTGYNQNVEILYPYFEENEVYESNNNHRLSTVIHSSLDEAENEEDKQNHWYRIRNWGNTGMPDDVYHYIYNLPKDKWLLPNHCYRFEGEVFQSCKYCGSTLLANHDGASNNTDTSLSDPKGVPYYKEEYDYNESTNTYEFRENIFYYSNDLHLATESHTFGEGFKYNNRAIIIPNNLTIRDIFFDVDNAALVNSSNSGYIEDRTLKDKDQYTQITIGGTFIDEQEELIINGRNMGIQLPKEIIKSIYESSFYHKYSNEKLLKDKMKELLLNYMSIKGECGNFKSIYNSLKWFGWGGKLEISKLIKTDNEFQNQFILDYFSITIDIKDVYRFFNPTNMISLSVKGNEEDRLDIQDHNNSFIGEGKPIMKDLFDEVVEVKDQGISFYKPYYDFVFTELALKLDCLKYYYQRYFLPIHIKINRASIDYKVYANTVKMTAMGFEKQTEAPVYIPNYYLKVIFPEKHELLYYRSEHYIDSMFNEFNVYNNEYNKEDLYYVNENCIIIPLKFKYLNKNYTENTSNISKGYFNCNIYVTYTIKKQYDTGHYVYKDGEYLYKEFFYNDKGYKDENGNYTYFWGNKETGNTLEYVPSKNRYNIITENLLDHNNSFTFYQSEDLYYKNLIIIPRLLKNKNIDWLNTDFRLSVLLNNTWFTYDFRVNIPDLYLGFGKLKYRYFIDNEFTLFNQVDKITDNDIKFNVFMYQPDLITINSLFLKENTDNEVQTFLEKIKGMSDYDMYEFYNKYYRKKIQVPYNKNYYNQIHLFNIYTSTKEQIEYNDNPKNIDLYRTFFNDDGTLKFNIKENIPYDFYLMHDKFIEGKKSYWYGVFISKYPIGNYNEEDLEIQNPFYNINENYELKYDGTSIEKFLINRMDIEKANGYNHFNQNDLIIVSVKNNDYHFNIDLTNKWTINLISDFNNTNVVKGNSNILIIPNNNYSHLYSPGYYNVLLNYSINGLADHNYLTKGYYRINYEVEDIEYPELIEIESEVKKYDVSNNSENNEEELWYIESSQNYDLKLIINLENNLIASIFYFCMINPGMFCILTINKNEFKLEQINMYNKNIEQTEIYNTNEILPTKPTIGNYIFNENNELKLIIGTTNFNGLVCYLYPNNGNINNYDLELGVGNDENINPLLRYHCQINDNIFIIWS